jgi:cystathionine beta-lyase/cystathionine gamma-synthase
MRFIDALDLFGIGYSWGLATPVDPARIRKPEAGRCPVSMKATVTAVRLAIGLEDPRI